MQEKLDQRHKEILRFILIARLFDFQYPTFYKGLKQEMKRRMGLFANSLNALLGLLRINLPPEIETQLDDTAALAWEVLDEFDKAPDKAMFLTVCRLFNEGLIAEEGEGIPLNEKGFKDLLQSKGEAA